MEINNNNFKRANLMGNKIPNDWDAVDNMDKVISNLGGTLHFIVDKSEDGWSAQCSEIEAIITGGTNPSATDEEIEKNIREAIHSAFNISEKIPSAEMIRNAELPSYKILNHAC